MALLHQARNVGSKDSAVSDLLGWDRLRHGGLLLDPPRLRRLVQEPPPPLASFFEAELRRRVAALPEKGPEVGGFVAFVLTKVCGFGAEDGAWQRGSDVGAEWSRRTVTKEAVRPRQLWRARKGGLLPVFVDAEPRLGIGRGRKIVSHALQWLRAGEERLALVTNGRQWRLVFAGLDFDAWCEWDIDLWFEEGVLSAQVTALRALLAPALWVQAESSAPGPLLAAIQDSRKGQAELSAVLGERVREAVELLVRAHDPALDERCADVAPQEIYRAACRVVMRMVVVLFAESRDLLPRDNALYHGSYGLNGLLGELERVAARGGRRLARSFSAWPRLLALFRLVHAGSHHPGLPVPAYGGELFAPADPAAADGLTRTLAVFESACFERELFSDHELRLLLERLTRTQVKLRQGRAATWVTVPVDFSDLSSEYIGILYEGLLDFELKTAPAGDPVVFLAVGNQPALPLSRLEAMDDRALANLLEKLRDTSSSDGGDGEDPGEDSAEESAEVETTAAADGDADGEDAQGPEDDADDSPQEPDPGDADESHDPRHRTRTRAEQWARRAVEVGRLVPRPRGRLTADRAREHEAAVARKARQLVTRVILPGERFLVRWGGTRKGSGTFYTRPGLAVPTVQRTLRPLAYDAPPGADGRSDPLAPAAAWTPKAPETILALKVCDPACGSGTFPVAALRFLTDALYASLFHHGRIRSDGDRALVRLLEGPPPLDLEPTERLGDELVPCRPEDPTFEPRLKALLRRHVVERCIHGVDLDPLAVELCRLSLWIETLDRSLPFTFLEHKIRCGNALVGAWFDQFQHYPVMAWKNREGGDRTHSNGVRYGRNQRTQALRDFANELKADLADSLRGQTRLFSPPGASPTEALAAARATLARLHELPVHDSAERARIYRDEFLGSDAYQALRSAMDLWCACWFWPADWIDVAPLPTTFASPTEDTLEAVRDIARAKRFFHWELAFPDVFHAPGAGFDAILGNPPWDIAKPSSKEFFSNLDPLYRTYGKQEALRRQTECFANREVEEAWLDYSADFRAQSNFCGYASSPFGDPEENEKSQDRFSIERGRAGEALHEIWRKRRAHSGGFADPAHPFRHQGSADLNLYKLFLELSHALLREGGRLGFVVPSGIYSDHGTGSLRALFLDRCRWEWLFGFENRDGIFAIHRSFKFNPILVQKGGTTEAIHTAFMRRRLEDWERAETCATPYTRAQVDRFSPRSKAILEIQSPRDLEILEKIYSNSVLLGDDGPNGWGIRYSREFDMTNDSKLFPPRPRWEEKGYRPDEYSRWILGPWRPIADLWPELEIDPTRPIALDPTCEAELTHRAADLQPTSPRLRLAQPPYDTLPVPRASLPPGILLSREADAWLREADIEDMALPLYLGRMMYLNQWAAGMSSPADGARLDLDPDFLLPRSALRHNPASGARLVFRDIARTTDARTFITALVPSFPCGNKVPLLDGHRSTAENLQVATFAASFTFDWAARARMSSTTLNWHIVESFALPARPPAAPCWLTASATLNLTGIQFAASWLTLWANMPSQWPVAFSPSERVRLSILLDAVSAAQFDLDASDLATVFTDCDHPQGRMADLPPKGFWRTDNDRDPELRQTVLTLVAFHDLTRHIESAGGDRERGIEAFLAQKDGQGWLLPETLRLADYGLGHDERAKEPQPVASRLGSRFYDWQLAQTPDESWRECHLHARNLLGKLAYLDLLSHVLADLAPARWLASLAPAADLTDPADLVTLFASPLARQPLPTWPAALDTITHCAAAHSLPFPPATRHALLARTLPLLPDSARLPALQHLDTHEGHDTLLTLLRPLLSNPDSPSFAAWHPPTLTHLGPYAHATLLQDLGHPPQSKVAETPARRPSTPDKTLFD